MSSIGGGEVELQDSGTHPTDTGVPPDWLWAGRVPSLDGLRAVAIGLVIVAHARGTPNAPFPVFFWAFGDLGVQLFFVISGFLITLLLIRERKRNGRISLKQFYLRRAVRIFPAYLMFMAFLGLMQALGVISIDANNWIHSLTFTLNLIDEAERQWNVAHVWSLCVEEHFYLIWPVIVATLGVAWSWRVGWFLILTAPIWRWVIGIMIPGTLPPQTFTFSRIDSIANGCCLALATTGRFSRQLTEFHFRRVAYVWSLIVVLLVIGRVLDLSYFVDSRMKLSFLHTITGVAFTLLLWVSICVPHGWVGRILNSKYLAWLGVLSYSLYLWQQPFLNRYNPSWMCVWPINLILALSLSACSYLVVERPLIRWRQRHGSVAR